MSEILREQGDVDGARWLMTFVLDIEETLRAEETGATTRMASLKQMSARAHRHHWIILRAIDAGTMDTAFRNLRSDGDCRGHLKSMQTLWLWGTVGKVNGKLKLTPLGEELLKLLEEKWKPNCMRSGIE